MRIFDAHAHLGQDVVFDVEVSEKDLDDVCKEFGVTGAMVQPFIPRPYLEDNRGIHDRIYRLTQQNPGKYYGMISIWPHFRPEDLEEEIKRCVQQLGFRGIKIATTAQGVSPSGASGMTIFDIAQQYKIPVMIHTGGGSFGAPGLLEKPAKAFREIPIIIAHGGGDDGVNEAVRLAQTYEQVYLEPSWRNVLDLQKMAQAVGAGKIMYSSDMPRNTPAQLAAFREVFKSQAEQEQVFYNTAATVFGL